MVRILGHRGARNLWAENSLGGFRNLIALGGEAVELDVHLTSDGEVAVIHDPLLERTTTGIGAVSSHTMEALGTEILKDTINETIPRLDQVLDIFQETSLSVDIEIKTDADGNPYVGLVKKVVALVEARGMQDQVCLTSFVPEVIEEIRAEAPYVRRLASIDRRSTELLGGLKKTLTRFLDLGCILAIEKELLGHSFNHCFSLTGTENLAVWVPNTPSEIAYWLGKPIRQLTTDRPDIALALRARQSFFKK